MPPPLAAVFDFKTNPNGAKRGATLGDEGKSFIPDWDGIWDCAAQITDKGWFAEIAIPWKTQRFALKDTFICCKILLIFPKQTLDILISILYNCIDN